MKEELYRLLGIDSSLKTVDILSQLENQQMLLLKQLDTVKNEEKEELKKLLIAIDSEIDRLKSEINGISKGIIIDKVNLRNTEQKKKENSTEKAERKIDAISKKVEGFKKAEAEKQIAAEERKRAESEKKKKTTTDSISESQSSKTQNSSASNPELAVALKTYKNGDFKTALGMFSKLAEAGNEIAQYLLAAMYGRGEGTPSSADRQEFWMKQSADQGYLSAQRDYGIICCAIASNSGSDEKLNEGLEYIAKAADKDDQAAEIKYIQIADHDDLAYRVYYRAIEYCKKLKERSNDSFDKEKYDEIREIFKKRYKTAKRIENKRKRAMVCSIIGSILLFVGVLYIIKGIYYAEWNNIPVLKWLPSQSRLGYSDSLLKSIYPYVGSDGLFGTWMFFAGWTLIVAGRCDVKKRIAELFEKVSIILCIAMSMIHMILSFTYLTDGKTILLWYFGIIVVATIIAEIMGRFLRTILRIKLEYRK